ncbi:energy-coupling factor transporter ATPase [Mycoplasma sp. SG1]|uniref:energy-coupling factor transporter ATPase n=1 Tax=Mycoplasma sp. SG1 TaxID=2810348 RepID=UPI0020244C89|nr:energy-coupling factor transporter ATPase [Mycoplasma sp. SG1]URM52918.1 ATP-binding cassette domain-containing protein [Mycoplasma sp. SG1]
MLKVKNLYFTYNNLQNTLDNVNIDFEEGKYYCIVGHNGSGKSTLSKLLVGIIKPSSGEIILDDENIFNDLKKSRLKIGIIFQNPDNQFIGSSVLDDIVFGLENHQVPRQEMEKKLEYVVKIMNLEKFLGFSPEHLSGGQKQRVAIAGILALDCKYIILDEATSMLDPTSANDFLKLIRTICKNEKKTIISITHNMEEAYNADHVVMLGNGVVLASDHPHKIFVQDNLLKLTKLLPPLTLQFKTKLINLGTKIDDDIFDLDKIIDQLLVNS